MDIFTHIEQYRAAAQYSFCAAYAHEITSERNIMQLVYEALTS